MEGYVQDIVGIHDNKYTGGHYYPWIHLLIVD